MAAIEWICMSCGCPRAGAVVACPSCPPARPDTVPERSIASAVAIIVGGQLTAAGGIVPWGIGGIVITTQYERQVLVLLGAIAIAFGVLVVLDRNSRLTRLGASGVGALAAVCCVAWMPATHRIVELHNALGGHAAVGFGQWIGLVGGLVTAAGSATLGRSHAC